MGSKKGAKELLALKDPAIPLIPGYNGEKQDPDTLIKEALRIGMNPISPLNVNITNADYDNN